MQRLWGFGSLCAAAVVVLGTLSVNPAAASSPMKTGGVTSQPIGHYEFCQANPNECSIRTSNPKPEKFTPALWRKIVSVNKTINADVKPISDADQFGVEEYWTLPTSGAGDCEEYVLAKQQALRDAGFAMSNLLITVLRKPDGEGHAILTVRTDKGDFVLDNLNEKVVEWHKTGYTYLKIQSSRNSGRWVSITNADVSSTASVP